MAVFQVYSWCASIQRNCTWISKVSLLRSWSVWFKGQGQWGVKLPLILIMIYERYQCKIKWMCRSVSICSKLFRIFYVYYIIRFIEIDTVNTLYEVQVHRSPYDVNTKATLNFELTIICTFTVHVVHCILLVVGTST